MLNTSDLAAADWGMATTKGMVAGGHCYKRINRRGSGMRYIKCSYFRPGQIAFGDEAAYEVVCSRLFLALGLPAVKTGAYYEEVVIDNVTYRAPVSLQMDYSRGYASRITLEDFVELNRAARGTITPYEVMKKFGFMRDLEKMLVADFLVIQQDRHGRNIEILEKNGNKGEYVLAPLFDNGRSFMVDYPSSLMKSGGIKNFDPMGNYRVNNYIGTPSLENNLQMMEQPVDVKPLSNIGRRDIFHHVTDMLPMEYRDKIWEIINVRYNYLKQGGFIREIQV